MVSNASPTSPSLLVSCEKELATEVAASTACDVAVTLLTGQCCASSREIHGTHPPMTTLSEYIMPEAPLPSPYEIFQVSPVRRLAVELDPGV